MRKKLLTMMFSLMLATSTILGLSVMSVSAATIAPSFEINQGASIRTQAPAGIRFETKISKSEYESLRSKNAEYGTLVIPEKALNGELTATVDEQGNIVVGENVLVVKAENVNTQVQDDQLTTDVDESAFVYYNAVIVGEKDGDFYQGLPEEFYDMKFVARSYVIYDSDEGKTIEFATNSANRSIAQVAATVLIQKPENVDSSAYEYMHDITDYVACKNVLSKVTVNKLASEVVCEVAITDETVSEVYVLGEDQLVSSENWNYASGNFTFNEDYLKQLDLGEYNYKLILENSICMLTIEMVEIEEQQKEESLGTVLYATGQTGYTVVTANLPTDVQSFDSVVLVDGENESELNVSDYSVADGKITFADSYITGLTVGEYNYKLSNAQYVLSLTVKKGDVIITSENWQNYLTTGLTSDNQNTTLATDDTTSRLTKYYILDTDIDYSTTTAYFLGIGRTSVSAANKAFSGTFDGNGHTISNWRAGKNATENTLTGQNAGFVSQLTGVIKNVGFVNATVVIRGSANGTAGIIAGALVGGTISNCYINGATLSSTSTQTQDNSSAGLIFGATGTGSSKVENVLVFGEINVTTGATTTANRFRGIGTASNTSGRLISVTNVYVTENITWKFFDGTNTTDSTYPSMILIDSNNYVTKTNASFVAESDMKIEKTDSNIYAPFNSLWKFTTGEFPKFN